MIAPVLPPFDMPDLGGRIAEHVAELIARLLLEAADAELAAEAEGQADEDGRPCG